MTQKKEQPRNAEGEPLETGALSQPADPMASVLETNQRLNEMVSEQAKRLARLEYSRGNPHRERMWDQMNTRNDDEITGTVPSFDRQDPVIEWSSKDKDGKPFGMVWQTGEADERKTHDTQCVHLKTLGGREEKLGLMELSARLRGNSIKAKCVNWLSVKAAVREVDALKCKFQKMVVTRSMAQTPKELLDEIERKEKALVMKVRLSDDLGKSYEGKELDLPMYLWNAVP